MNNTLLTGPGYEFHLHRLEVLYCKNLESQNRCFECQLDDCSYGEIHGIDDESA